MSTISDPGTGNDGFRIGMLINDTRYRSYTFQFIALIALIFGIGYLVSNLFANLAANGLNISWAFLGEPAGYDINQRPSNMTRNRPTHVRRSLGPTIMIVASRLYPATCWGHRGVLRCRTTGSSAADERLCGAFRNVPALI